MKLGSAWLLSASVNAFNLCIGIGLGVLTARYLGPEGRGEVAKAVYYAGLAATFGMCSVTSAVTMLIAGGKPEKTVVADAAVLLAGLSAVSVLVAVPCIAVLEGFSERWGMLAMFVAAFLPLHFLDVLLVSRDLGLKEFRRYNAFRLLPGAITLAGLAVLAISGRLTVEGVLVVYVCTPLLVLASRFAVSPRLKLGTTHRAGRAELLRLGLRHQTSGIAAQIFQAADRLIVIMMLTEAHLGFYAIALTFASAAAGIVSTASAVILFPVLSAVETDLARRRFVLITGMTATVLAGIGVNAVLILAAPWLVPLLFGQSFAEATSPAMVLALSQIPACVVQVGIVALRALGAWRPGHESQLIGLGLLVPVGVALCASHGLSGLAVGMVVAHTACAIYIVRRLNAAYGTTSVELLVPGRQTFDVLLARSGPLMRALR